MQINERQLELVNRQIERLIAADNFYGRRLKQAGITGCDSVEDFVKLPFSQTGNALATHLIDASENNLLAYASAEHHRHAPHLTLTHHTFSPEVLVMSRRSWDALSQAEQAMLRRAAREARPMMRDMWQQREERVEALLRLGGVSFVELPPAERARFEAALRPLHARFVGSAEQRRLIARIRALR